MGFIPHWTWLIRAFFVSRWIFWQIFCLFVFIIKGDLLDPSPLDVQWLLLFLGVIHTTSTVVTWFAKCGWCNFLFGHQVIQYIWLIRMSCSICIVVCHRWYREEANSTERLSPRGNHLQTGDSVTKTCLSKSVTGQFNMYVVESIKCLMLFQEELAEKGGEHKVAGLSLCILTGRLLAALHTYEPSLLYVVGWMVSGGCQGEGIAAVVAAEAPFVPLTPRLSINQHNGYIITSKASTNPA